MTLYTRQTTLVFHESNPNRELVNSVDRLLQVKLQTTYLYIETSHTQR